MTVNPSLLHLGREAITLALLLSAPPLCAALFVGLLTGVGQAATQIQEATLGVVPRLAAVLVTLLLAGPWIGARLVRFAGDCLALAVRIAAFVGLDRPTLNVSFGSSCVSPITVTATVLDSSPGAKVRMPAFAA